MIFVHLDVGAKFQMAMFEVVDTLASDERARADGVRDASTSGKTVQPKDAGINHLNDEAGRHTLEGQGIVDTAGALLDSADVYHSMSPTCS